MRAIWGFMLENTYFTEFDLANHRIIEEAYRQRKTRQTSHYINIRDSHLPVQARVYFGVEQIHLRMPGTRYYVKRRIVASSSSCSTSSITMTPPEPRQRNVSPATQANNSNSNLQHWSSYPLATPSPMGSASSTMCAGQCSTTTTMMPTPSNLYLSPLPPPPPSMLMAPPYSQASSFQDYGGPCSSSSSSTCTSGSSTPGTLDVLSTAANQTPQPHLSANMHHFSTWQQVPSQSTATSILLDHLAMANKLIPPSSWQRHQHSLLTDAVHHTTATAAQPPADMYPVAANNDMAVLASMHVPWTLGDEMYAFGDPTYLMPSSIQPF